VIPQGLQKHRPVEFVARTDIGWEALPDGAPFVEGRLLSVVELGWANRPEVVSCLPIALIFIAKTYYLPRHRLYGVRPLNTGPHSSPQLLMPQFRECGSPDKSAIFLV
jgi:hypothetical protein